MVLPPCFHLADEVFPRVRRLAARRLTQTGWTQRKVADALGVSQVMVRRYVHAATADRTPGGPEAIHDPGAIGMEPCPYLFGPDAESVVGSALRIFE